MITPIQLRSRGRLLLSIVSLTASACTGSPVEMLDTGDPLDSAQHPSQEAGLPTDERPATQLALEPSAIVPASAETTAESGITRWTFYRSGPSAILAGWGDRGGWDHPISYVRMKETEAGVMFDYGDGIGTLTVGNDGYLTGSALPEHIHNMSLFQHDFEQAKRLPYSDLGCIAAIGGSGFLLGQAVGACVPAVALAGPLGAIACAAYLGLGPALGVISVIDQCGGGGVTTRTDVWDQPQSDTVVAVSCSSMDGGVNPCDANDPATMWFTESKGQAQADAAQIAAQAQANASASGGGGGDVTTPPEPLPDVPVTNGQTPVITVEDGPDVGSGGAGLPPCSFGEGGGWDPMTCSFNPITGY
jgi:hypothetical protein